MFVHLICLGLIISFSGIRLSLKFVTIPPAMISIGKTQGVLKKNIGEQSCQQA